MGEAILTRRGGGEKYQFIDDGIVRQFTVASNQNIKKGDPVIINRDNTVSQFNGITNLVPIDPRGKLSYSKHIVSLGNDRFLILISNGTTQGISAIVVQVNSDNSISIGSIIALTNIVPGSTDTIDFCVYDDNKVAIIFEDYSTRYPYIQLISITGLTISVGTPMVLASTRAMRYFVRHVSSTRVIAPMTFSSGIELRMVNISNLTPSLGITNTSSAITSSDICEKPEFVNSNTLLIPNGRSGNNRISAFRVLTTSISLLNAECISGTGLYELVPIGVDNKIIGVQHNNPAFVTLLYSTSTNTCTIQTEFNRVEEYISYRVFKVDNKNIIVISSDAYSSSTFFHSLDINEDGTIKSVFVSLFYTGGVRICPVSNGRYICIETYATSDYHVGYALKGATAVAKQPGISGQTIDVKLL